MPAVTSPLFAGPAAQVYADALGITHLIWQAGRRTLADFQAALDALLPVLRQQQTGKVLLDQTALAPLSPAEQQWVLTHWLPRAVAQGYYRYAAVLQARDPVTRLSTAQVQAPAQDPGLAPRYALFDEQAAALAWLRRQVVVESRRWQAGPGYT